MEGFDNGQDVVFDKKSTLFAASPDIIAVALRLHSLAPALVQQFTSLKAHDLATLVHNSLTTIETFIRAIRDRSTALIAVHNFEMIHLPAYGLLDAQMSGGQTETLRAMNRRLREIVSQVSGAFIIDVERLVSRVGYENAIDDRYWHVGRAPYKASFQRDIAREYVKLARALKGKNKKCLVLDCDNTLWGGVVGEDGLSGIKLGTTNPGSAFVEMQAAILDLYNRGILLALNSKNNHADAYEVFQRHPDSLLRPEHFVAMRINWEDKVSNLRQIAAELNIGLDSLVFVDDNPFECEYVRDALPQVETVELPADPSRYAGIIRGIDSFDTLTLSEEDRRRSELYRAESARIELRTSAGSMGDYLRSLGLKIAVHKGDAFHVPRIAQLTQKTNQFNLTTRRYSESDITAMLADPSWRVYYAELEDKFSRAGLVAVALTRDDGAICTIDSYLLSCRVIGRGVEQAFLSKVADDARERGARRLVGEFIPTAKNAVAADFYGALGFVKRGETAWELDTTAAIAVPDWFVEASADI